MKKPARGLPRLYLIVGAAALALAGCDDGARGDDAGPDGGRADADAGPATSDDAGPAPDDGGPAPGDGGAPGDDAGPPAPPGARSAGCGMARDPGFTCFDVVFEGAMRNWCINIPDSYDPNHAYELVIGLHGCGGNNRAVHGHRAPMEADGVNEFLFVYPQAAASCWDYGATIQPGSDVSFIQHMVSEAQAMTCLDTERTFVHGMSSGGSMAPNVVTAGIAIGFACAAGNGTTARPTPAWYYGGRTDGYYDLIHSAMESQARTNGCPGTTSPIADSPCVRYDGCTMASLVYCEDDRGHVWPREEWAQGGILDVFRAAPR